MTCLQTCHTDRTAAEKDACRVTCSRVERMVHNILRPNAASLGLIDAQAGLLASLGSAAQPRL